MTMVSEQKICSVCKRRKATKEIWTKVNGKYVFSYSICGSCIPSEVAHVNCGMVSDPDFCEPHVHVASGVRNSQVVNASP